MPDIFISYARDNSHGQHLAERIHEQLLDAKFTVFRDVHGIAAGDQWVRVLEAELTASRLVVLVVSQKVLESQWVFSELSIPPFLIYHDASFIMGFFTA